jgi:hypothetical protein
LIRRSLFFVLGWSLSLSVTAKDIVDLYGIDDEQSAKIIKKYAKQVGELETLIMKEVIKMNKEGKESEIIKTTLLKKHHLIEKIKNEFGLYFVDFQTIFYPQDKNLYTTIEVVSKNQLQRQRLITKRDPSKTNRQPDDLINKMIRFEKTHFQLIVNNDLNLKEQSCPVYHCLSGFNHPKLAPYLKIFNTGAVLEKKLIEETLNKDPNPQRRAAAAYLVGHYRDPREIVSVLTPHVEDSDNGVRNNVMRVIGVTLQKAKIRQIEVMPFLRLLDSPYTTDRNKALFVLLQAAESDSAKDVLIQKGKDKLLALLQLKQPNNHGGAYTVLKKISGKDFGDTNIRAWENWFSKAFPKRT